MSDYVNFIDFNFKLAVVQVLMYERSLLMPKFDIYAFVKQSPRAINIEEEGYEVIPEARSYFQALAVPRKMLSQVDKLIQDGGNEIHHQLIPFWDGEDDVFNITSTEDVKLLPNLKRVQLLYDNDRKMVEEFRRLGIEADYI